MDFDDFKELLTFAIILVPIFFGYISEMIKKKKQHQNTSARPSNPTIKTSSFSHIPSSPILMAKEESVKHAEIPAFIEGERVTDDNSAEIKENKPINYNELKREDLRRAIIWNEILTPKFDR